MLVNWETKIVDYDPPNEKWDGYWRILIFDIPEKFRQLRDDLRVLINILGFKQLQKSVWITPYKIPKFILNSINHPIIRKFIRYAEVKYINYDLDLRREFLLKR